ncbi:hypothetical protein [Microbacterium sp. RURRCA19A]|uniref:hypothetical protein n=1 Tax=Microbacterium sp. RURRCA19A TaxID=1907391 RepID=UPI00095647F9|nr:hypothetical protein [Microbacterium sp. RURRCA19A]SIR46989.1 hypothetical protein SAMN05880568_0098 [Microbacterium sp. RURRCA19A]
MGASVIVGSLGGVPPASRVAANAVNAQNRIPAIEAAIQRMRDAGRGGEVASLRAERLAAIDRLEKQLDYLHLAVSGDVQLYLYEPDSQSIIEMIGTLDGNTTDVITYVPGTYTSVHSFYGDEVQAVGRWLERKDPHLVTFAWKEGTFPGENAQTGAMNLIRIGEANDEVAALDKGRAINAFQEDLYASSTYAAVADHAGMGHSWGLAGIAASEVSGADYAEVHSLAGAGMPSGWAPSVDTRYFHWSYADALSMAQSTGLVWDGRIPEIDSAFTTRVYGKSGDFSLYLPGLLGAEAAIFLPGHSDTIPATIDPIGNHNLIASDQVDNQRALNDILREVQR